MRNNIFIKAILRRNLLYLLNIIMSIPFRLFHVFFHIMYILCIFREFFLLNILKVQL